MKRLLIVLIVGGLVYGGWVFYQNYTAQNTNSSISTVAPGLDLSMTDSSSGWDNVQSVLGASISNVIETGKEWIDEASGGQAEPVINRAINNFQEELKDLPKEQVERIKYDFCKPIVESYKADEN